MKFNINKSKVLHIGSKNSQIQYSMKGRQFSAVNKEKDLEVLVTSDLKSNRHCSQVFKTANKLVNFIRRVLKTKSENNIKSL